MQDNVCQRYHLIFHKCVTIANGCVLRFQNMLVSAFPSASLPVFSGSFLRGGACLSAPYDILGSRCYHVKLFLRIIPYRQTNITRARWNIRLGTKQNYSEYLDYKYCRSSSCLYFKLTLNFLGTFL